MCLHVKEFITTPKGQLSIALISLGITMFLWGLDKIFDYFSFKISLPVALMYLIIGAIIIYLGYVAGNEARKESYKRRKKSKNNKKEFPSVKDNKIEKKVRNLVWLLATIAVFLITTWVVFIIAKSLEHKPSLPIDLTINIAYTNITNHFICNNGITHRNFIVRGDSLQCNILTVNKPDDPNYNIIIERGFLEAQQSYILWNYIAYPNIKINESSYRSESFTLPIPDTQIFGLLFEQKGMITPPPVWLETLSETDVSQGEINFRLTLITSIIALLGIIPASKAIRDLWNYNSKRGD